MGASASPRCAVVGLGSSLGDRQARLQLAVRLLHAQSGVRVLRSSRLFRSPPWGGVARNWFLNGAVLVDSRLEARELLALCKATERRLGRREGLRWGDRVLDLDLLVVGGFVVDDPDAQLPHPRIAERAFVVEPLEEVLPGARNPITGRRFLDEHRELGPRATLPRAVPVGVLWRPRCGKADS